MGLPMEADPAKLLSEDNMFKQMFNKFILTTAFILASCVAYTTPALAADLNQVLDKMQQTYQRMDSMVCDFNQTLLHKESGGSETRKGVLKFKKPMLVHWDVKGKESEILVINKKEIWDYLVDEEVAYRYSLQLVEDSNSFIRVVTGQANVRQDFEAELESEQNGIAQLHLYPRNPTQQLTEAYLWVDVNSGTIKKLKVFDFFGNENEVEFTSIKMNANLSDSTFNFTPPKGVDVEDRIENNNVPEKNLFQ